MTRVESGPVTVAKVEAKAVVAREDLVEATSAKGVASVAKGVDQVVAVVKMGSVIGMKAQGSSS